MKNQKKLMVVIWNMDIGGVQKRVKDLVIYLSKNPSLRIELLVKRAYSTTLLEQVKKCPNINIHYFSKSQSKKLLPSFLWLFINFLVINPDIVLTFLDRLSIQMIFLKKIIFWRKTKLILSEEVCTSIYLNMYERGFWKKLVKLFYPIADKIITPTRVIKQDLQKNFGIPKEKIKVISSCTLLKPPKKFGPKIYDFIYIGRLDKEKNIFWLIDLIKNYKNKPINISLCILGKGKLEREMLRKIKEYGLEKYIFYYGFQDNISFYLNRARVFLLPSVNEGMPNCVLEAGIYKLPCVVNNFPGANEIVRHTKTGFISNNKQDFFQYAESLQKNEKLRIKMGLANQKMVIKDFGKEKLIRFIKAIIA